MNTYKIEGYSSDNPEQALSYLRRNRVDLDHQQWSPSSDTFLKFSGTLLYIASFENKPNIVAALLQAGVDPNRGIDEESKKDTPLIIACKMGHYAVAKQLVTKANLRLANDQGFTPLFVAYGVGAYRIAELLRSNGVGIDEKNAKGETILTFACKHRAPGTAIELIRAGANANLANTKGRTPFAIVVKRIAVVGGCSNDDRQKYRKVLKLLVAAGVDVHQFLAPNMTAMILAHQLRNEDLKSLLQKSFAKRKSVNLISKEQDQAVAFLELYIVGLEKSSGIDTAFHASLNFFSLKCARDYLKKGTPFGKEFASPWNNMLVACLQENIPDVKGLLSTPISKHEKDNRGITPIEVAYFVGNPELIRIIEEGPNEEAKKSDMTALDAVSYYGHHHLAKKYQTTSQVKKGSNEFVVTLGLALSEGHVNVARALIFDSSPLESEGYDIVLELFSTFGQVQLVEELRNKYQDTFSKTSKISPLYFACAYNQTDLALSEINLGAPVDVADERGVTALFWTCQHNNSVLVNAILAKLPGLTRGAKQKAIDVVLENGSLDVLKLLLSKEDLEDKEFLGQCLIKSSHFGQRGVVGFLLAKGANVNAKDKGGSTALHRATSQSDIAVVRELLSYRADVNVKNAMGSSAISIAHKASHLLIYNMLNMASSYSVQEPQPEASLGSSLVASISRFSAVFEGTQTTNVRQLTETTSESEQGPRV